MWPVVALELVAEGWSCSCGLSFLDHPRTFLSSLLYFISIRVFWQVISFGCSALGSASNLFFAAKFTLQVLRLHLLLSACLPLLCLLVDDLDLHDGYASCQVSWVYFGWSNDSPFGGLGPSSDSEWASLAAFPIMKTFVSGCASHFHTLL